MYFFIVREVCRLINIRLTSLVAFRVCQNKSFYSYTLSIQIKWYHIICISNIVNYEHVVRQPKNYLKTVIHRHSVIQQNYIHYGYSCDLHVIDHFKTSLPTLSLAAIVRYRSLRGSGKSIRFCYRQFQDLWMIPRVRYMHSRDPREIVRVCNRRS